MKNLEKKEEWKEVIDFKEIKSDGVDINEILEIL